MFFAFWTSKEQFVFSPLDFKGAVYVFSRFRIKGFFLRFCNLRSYSPVPPVAPSPLSRPGRLLYKSSQVGAFLCLGCQLGSFATLTVRTRQP